MISNLGLCTRVGVWTTDTQRNRLKTTVLRNLLQMNSNHLGNSMQRYHAKHYQKNITSQLDACTMSCACIDLHPTNMLPIVSCSACSVGGMQCLMISIASMGTSITTRTINHRHCSKDAL